jgi:spermidine synthase
MTRKPLNKTIHTEWLNPNTGYFYTVSRRLYSCKTSFQKLDLVDTDEFGRVLILDGITQVAQSSEFAYHEPMVHPAMCTHPSPRRVLVIGAGDGGIIREVLKYPCVESVVLAELDAGVIAFSKKYLPSIHKGAFSDPRLSIHIVDGRKYVEEHPGCFDIVIMDMTDPFGPSKYLYTKDFFSAVKRSFRTKKGVFAMHTESPIARPKTFSCIQHTLGSVFSYTQPLYVYIQMYAVLWSITVCSDGSDTAAMKPAAIDRKLSAYTIRNLRFYNGIIHQASQAAWPYITDLLINKSRVLTDAHPDIPDEIVHK